jgi:hypothetical protein
MKRRGARAGTGRDAVVRYVPGMLERAYRSLMMAPLPGPVGVR